MQKRFVRLKDIAADCGVSCATVSDVLNGKAEQKQIAAATVRRVLQAAARLNYQVNLAARNLTRKRSDTIGVLFGVLDSPFFGKIAHGVFAGCREHGALPVTCLSFGQAELEDHALTHLLGARVDGLVVVPATREFPTARIKQIEALGVPLVLVEQGANVLADFFGFDNAGGIRSAVQHLAAAGRLRPVLVARSPDSPVSQQRVAGFRQALAEAGLAESARSIHWLQEHHADESDIVACGWLQGQLILRADPPPDAILALNDDFALGLYRAVAEAGFEVGHEVAVIGYGDRQFAAHLRPSLTTLRQELEPLGRAAVERLFDRLAGRAAMPPEPRLLPTPLIRRDSA